MPISRIKESLRDRTKMASIDRSMERRKVGAGLLSLRLGYDPLQKRFTFANSPMQCLGVAANSL